MRFPYLPLGALVIAGLTVIAAPGCGDDEESTTDAGTGGTGGMGARDGGTGGTGGGTSTGGTGGGAGGAGGGTGGAGGGAGGAGGGGAALSFATDIYPLMNAKYFCTACHGASGSLTLSGGAAAAHANLVGVASMNQSCANKTRVVANKPQESFLVDKLKGKMSQGGTLCESGGERMPRPANAAPVSATDLALVEEWIRQGAKP